MLVGLAMVSACVARTPVDVARAEEPAKENGTFTVLGRWADWVFPAGSFGDEPGVLDGTEVPAMSVAGLLAMKEQSGAED